MNVTAMPSPAPPEETPAAALNVKDLRVRRVRQGRSETIVSGVNLHLGAGETIGIVGESGSGKSITARSIIGLLPRTLEASGTVLYGGRDLLGQRHERDWRQVRGRDIGMVMQDPFTMLSPVMRCGRILDESLRPEVRARMSRAERRAEAVRRLA